jgi:polyhydroxyalkanoate synthesis regulator phasin
MAIGDLNGARERAEELLQNLHKRARDLWESDTAHSVRSLIDDNAAAHQARRHFDATVEKVKASPLGHYLNPHEIEKLAQTSWHRFLEILPVATKTELAEVGKQVKSLNKKISELSKKMGERDAVN